MPDREKVIKGIQECDLNGGLIGNCPYKGILALLKEQKPIMIKTVMINGSGRNGRCQNCLMMLNEMDYPNFCGNCGQAVMWE